MTTGTATSELITKAQAARQASRRVRMLSTEQKNSALRAIADALEADCPAILEANERDLEAGRDAGLSEALQGRLLLNEQRVAGMANDVRSVALLPDPVGECFDSRTLPNGIRVERRRVPLGVIGCVYEARPNVTTDIVSLCLKSGNAVVLRGGKEAVHTNTAVAALVKDALEAADAVPEAVQFVTDTDRAIVDQMIRLNDYLDLFIPRGGDALIRYVRDNATVPRHHRRRRGGARLRGCRCRPGEGFGHRLQRQDAAAGRVQRPRYAARARDRCPRVPSRRRVPPHGGGRRTAVRPAGAVPHRAGTGVAGAGRRDRRTSARSSSPSRCPSE